MKTMNVFNAQCIIFSNFNIITSFLQNKSVNNGTIVKALYSFNTNVQSMFNTDLPVLFIKMSNFNVSCKTKSVSTNPITKLKTVFSIFL